MSLHPVRTQWRLLRKLLPLSLSDVAMTLGDPLQTIALGRLPGTQQSLASIGIVKAFAVFLESPIIMMLHASTALSRDPRSQKALWRFMVLMAAGLTVLFLIPALFPRVYEWLMGDVFGAPREIMEGARGAYLLMVIWPATIAWRRFHQGILIRAGRNRLVARASFLRIAWIAASLAVGLYLAHRGIAVSGATLAAFAMAGGVVIEGALATWFANDVDLRPSQVLPPSTALPSTVKHVARYYWPLAITMLVVWGGRAALVGVAARASDGPLALAAWPAAWGFVLVIANSSRMVQQLVLSDDESSDGELIQFAVSIGLLCSLSLVFLGFTSSGERLLSLLLGASGDLVEACRDVVRICVLVPFLVCLQNTFQGFLIRAHKTSHIQLLTMVAIGVMLALCFLGVKKGLPGASTAAWSMVAGAVIEVSLLAWVTWKEVILAKPGFRLTNH